MASPLRRRMTHVRLIFRKNEDISLLTQILLQNPFMDADKWNTIRDSMNVTYKDRNFTRRGVKERAMYLLQVFNFETQMGLKSARIHKGGTDRQYEEQDSLLRDVLALAKRSNFRIPNLPEHRRAALLRYNERRLMKPLSQGITKTSSMESCEDTSSHSYFIASSSKESNSMTSFLESGPSWAPETQDEPSLDIDDSNAFIEETSIDPDLVYSPCGSLASVLKEENIKDVAVETDRPNGLLKANIKPKLEALRFLEKRQETDMRQKAAERNLEVRRLDLMEKQLRLDTRRLELEEKRHEDDRLARQIEQQRFWEQMEHLRMEHANLLKIVLTLVSSKIES